MPYTNFLKNHQLEAIKKMHNGCILHGGVGTGKSRTALAYFYQWSGGVLKYPIDDEPVDQNITELKSMRYLYIITTARKRDTEDWLEELPYFLIKSEQVTVDSWNNIKKYAEVKDCFFIFDEQRVVGNGVWVKSFLKIVKSNPWILLSATPGDTWEDYIPVFIANGFYRNRTQFYDEHVIRDWSCKYPKVKGYINTQRLIRLRNAILVEMPMIRNTVPHHIDIRVEYDRRLYKDIGKNRWNYWEDRPIETASEVCLAWRRVVNEDPSRQIAVLEILEKSPKAIIFYTFDYELEILRNLSYPEGTEIAEWNGHKHQPIPTGDKWVYLVQYTAGSEGWNCITTDTIIFYSQNHSYKALAQAQGRIDRMNTSYVDLYYYYLKSVAPIDRAISLSLAEKRDFNDGKYVNHLGRFSH